MLRHIPIILRAAIVALDCTRQIPLFRNVEFVGRDPRILSTFIAAATHKSAMFVTSILYGCALRCWNYSRLTCSSPIRIIAYLIGKVD
jgi:hypothetical protein